MDNNEKKREQLADTILSAIGIGAGILVCYTMHFCYHKGLKDGLKLGFAKGTAEGKALGYLKATSDVTDAYLADPDELRCFFDKHIENCKLTDDEIRNAIQNGHHLLETWLTVKN